MTRRNFEIWLENCRCARIASAFPTLEVGVSWWSILWEMNTRILNFPSYLLVRLQITGGFEGQFWTVSPLSKNAVKVRRCGNRATSKQHLSSAKCLLLLSVLLFHIVRLLVLCPVQTNTNILSCYLGKSES